MSSIFEKAQKYCSYFLKIHEEVNLIRDSIKKKQYTSFRPFKNNTSTYNIFGASNAGIRISINTTYTSNIYYVSRDIDQPNPDTSYKYNNFLLIYSTKFLVNGTIIELQDLSSFDEGIEFQLSTTMNNEELFEYFCCCILYFSGFRGKARTDVHPNTWNAIYRQVLGCKKERKIA